MAHTNEKLNTHNTTIYMYNKIECFFLLFFFFYYGHYCVLGMMIGGEGGERVAKVSTEWQQHTVYKIVLLGFNLA